MRSRGHASSRPLSSRHMVAQTQTRSAHLALAPIHPAIAFFNAFASAPLTNSDSVVHNLLLPLKDQLYQPCLTPCASSRCICCVILVALWHLGPSAYVCKAQNACF